MDQLDELKFMPPSRYKGQRVSRALVNSVQIYHTALVVLICLSIGTSTLGYVSPDNVELITYSINVPG